MQWFEPLIAIGAVALVVAPIVSSIVKNKKGTARCECGKLKSECIANCKVCNSGDNALVEEYRKAHQKKASGVYTYTIGIRGMKCGMCETHINDAIRNSFDVIKVEASRKKKQAIVQSKKVLSLDELKKTVTDLGYDVTSAKLN